MSERIVPRTGKLLSIKKKRRKKKETLFRIRPRLTRGGPQLAQNELQHP